MKVTIILILLTIAIQSNCRNIFMVPDKKTTAYFQCILKSGYDRVIIYTNQNGYNSINPDKIQNAINAKNAGLNIQVSFFPCRGRTIEQTLQILDNAFSMIKVEKYWAVFEMDDDDTYWPWNHYSPESNCRYLVNLIKAMKSRFNIDMGIISDYDSWVMMMKDKNACPEIKDSSLWWQPPQFDNRPDFDTYVKFGGWDVPTLKLFTIVPICGDNGWNNYYV